MKFNALWVIFLVTVVQCQPSTATAINQCTLTWNANGESDLSRYGVYESLVNPPNQSTDRKLETTSTMETCDRLNLQADGKVHYFAVDAVDTSDNRSPLSNVVSKQFAQAEGQDPTPVYSAPKDGQWLDWQTGGRTLAWTDTSNGTAQTEIRIITDGVNNIDDPSITQLVIPIGQSLTIWDGIPKNKQPSTFACAYFRHIYPDGHVSSWIISSTEGICRPYLYTPVVEVIRLGARNLTIDRRGTDVYLTWDAGSPDCTEFQVMRFGTSAWVQASERVKDVYESKLPMPKTAKRLFSIETTCKDGSIIRQHQGVWVENGIDEEIIEK